MSDEVLIELRDDQTLWLTINREKQRNAINAQVLEGLSQGLDQAMANPDIRAVVLTGAGAKAFCAGGDLQSNSPFSVDYSSPYAGAAQLFRKAKQTTVPLIARVNGACLAGGMGLLSMCDLAVAVRTASFGLPEVKVGMFPAQVLSLLQHQIPRRSLNELCLLGDTITAEMAYDIGLVNGVTDNLDDELNGILARLSERSPAAIRRGLYTLKKMEAMPFEEAISFAETQVALFALTEDAKEGVRAFQEKRKPVWTGK
ncbi:enoyl-CoA hydratase-related protein [Magnetospirillum sp. 15-1]|uniref:enoyl-CoA hydratase-related protein n=1 Tax=Magnetospirillum sp. 15-1 TaxID=1979370 RepID=UPI000BBCF043|nr:enoyl-CoA hydratase-related protein [Magnetospirillum sp. 15-1]